MLVYGDPQFKQSLQDLLAHLHRRAASANAESLDDLRELLIFSGQIEQAVADSDCSTELKTQIATVTDQFAASFYALRAEQSERATEPPENFLARCVQALNAIQLTENPLLTVKIPEGFAFYALFPEQYCAAARIWAAAHREVWPGLVLVIGVRSIGTSLSAAAAATLAAENWKVKRITVRPIGHPFQRQVELSPSFTNETKCALVVDEGPGISGSSMAATAFSLKAAGIQDVSFLPSHSGEPAKPSSVEILQCWQQTPRFLAKLDELKWQGQLLSELLTSKATELLKAPEPFEFAEDLSAGVWRKFAFQNEADWPAVAAQFERMKFRCTNRSGTAVLWKFCGFGNGETGESLIDLAFQRLSKRAKEGFTPQPIGIFRGFVLTPWIEGMRLKREDSSDPAILNHIGNYILRSAASPSPKHEEEAAKARLAEMLFWNTKEILGNVAAESTRRFIEFETPVEMPAYGDGHLAPHEWVRDANGSIWKLDAEGHDCDHTLVGKQPILWDIAGATIEWNLDSNSAEALPRPLKNAGIPCSTEALKFYQAAYAAFRLGLHTLAKMQTDNAQEQNRFEESAAYYRTKLEQLLNAESVSV